MKKILALLLTAVMSTATIAAPVIVMARPAPVIVRPVAPRVATPAPMPAYKAPVATAKPVERTVTATPVVIPPFVNSSAVCTDSKKKNNQC